MAQSARNIILNSYVSFFLSPAHPKWRSGKRRNRKDQAERTKFFVSGRRAQRCAVRRLASAAGCIRRGKSEHSWNPHRKWETFHGQTDTGNGKARWRGRRSLGYPGDKFQVNTLKRSFPSQLLNQTPFIRPHLVKKRNLYHNGSSADKWRLRSIQQGVKTRAGNTRMERREITGRKKKWR